MYIGIVYRYRHRYIGNDTSSSLTNLVESGFILVVLIVVILCRTNRHKRYLSSATISIDSSLSEGRRTLRQTTQKTLSDAEEGPIYQEPVSVNHNYNNCLLDSSLDGGSGGYTVGQLYPLLAMGERQGEDLIYSEPHSQHSTDNRREHFHSLLLGQVGTAGYRL